MKINLKRKFVSIWLVKTRYVKLYLYLYLYKYKMNPYNFFKFSKNNISTTTNIYTKKQNLIKNNLMVKNINTNIVIITSHNMITHLKKNNNYFNKIIGYN